MPLRGAVLGCKLGRLWRRPCSKDIKPQRAHGLAMHHAVMPLHEELWTSASPPSFVAFALPRCSPWLQVGEIVEEALLQECQTSKNSHLAHASCHHAASRRAANGRNASCSFAHASPPCSPWLRLGEEVEEALLQECQASKSSHLAHASWSHTALGQL